MHFGGSFLTFLTLRKLYQLSVAIFLQNGSFLQKRIFQILPAYFCFSSFQQNSFWV
jgi:hypothetical protein